MLKIELDGGDVVIRVGAESLPLLVVPQGVGYLVTADGGMKSVHPTYQNGLDWVRAMPVPYEGAELRSKTRALFKELLADDRPHLSAEQVEQFTKDNFDTDAILNPPDEASPEAPDPLS